MNNNIQCSIESSITSMELNSAADGIFLVPELEGLAGLPEIRTTSGVNAGYDGGWTSAQNYDARLIAIRGVIANKDIAKVEAMRRKLASLLGQGRKEQLTLRFTTEAGNAYTINVRTISCEMALQRVLNKQDFLIQLRADDPLIYDDGASGGTEAILRVQQALGGFEINFGLPLAIGGSSDATAVENGAETVYPIIKLYGPLHSPTVVNMTTNQQMQIIADLGYTINWSGWTGVSGERLSIPNELDKEAPLRLWSVDGNTTQQTCTGKNLLHVTKASSTDNGVTFTVWSDGTVTTMGTATALVSINLILGQNSYSLPAGTYTLSGCPTGGSDSKWRIDINNGADGNMRDYGSGATFTLTSTLSVSSVRIRVASGTNMNGLTFKPMIESGSQPTAYEPFVGGQPSPSPSYPQPIQTVTGRQTIGIVGKNLYDPNSTVFSIPANVSVEVDGNSVKVTTLVNTTSNDLFWRTPIPDAMLENGKTYTASCVLGSGAYRSLKLQLRNHDGTHAGFSNGYTITYDSNYTLFVVENPFAPTTATQVAAGTTCTISNIQVEEGSTATAYEPYKAQDYEINLGKNLWGGFANDFTKSFGGFTFVTKTDGTITNTAGTASSNAYSLLTADATSNGFVKTLGAGTYHISGATNGILLTVLDVSSGAVLATDSGNGQSFTLSGQKTVFVRATVPSGTTVTEGTTKPQLERGSTASSYSAYFEPIELCKIGTYQDRIYKENGKWWLHKEIGKVVFDGSENWSLINAGSSNFYYNLPVFVTPKDQDIMPVSNYFVGTPITNGNTSVGLWITNAGTIRARKETEQTLADYKTWLGTALPSVYYVLATPTTTEITNVEVLEGLEGLGGATLYVGANNIYTDTPSALPTLEVDYPTDYDETHDTVVIDSQARTITLNGADIYHLKTEESEFPVLAPGENRMYLTSATTSDTGYAEVKFKQGYLSI